MQLDIERLLQVARAAGALSGQQPGFPLMAQKEAALTLSTMASMYGTSQLFSMCGDNDLLSLTIENEAFLDWLGWKPNNDVRQFIKLISYVGPSGTAAGSASSGVAAACDDPNSVEFGAHEVLLPDKGRIKRAGPVRDLTENNRKICDEYPIFTKDGQQITDEIFWSLTLAGIAVKQDLKRLVVTGNAANANEFSGLQTLVNTGYKDAHTGIELTSMNSIVVNWANNPMSYQLNGTHRLVDYLIDIVRRIRTKVRWSNLGGIGLGDMVINMPSYLRDELLDAFTCWSVCDSNIDQLSTMEARTFRNTLNGGFYGHGQIYVDGQPVPIITYDWQDLGQAAPYFTGDIYVLTRRIGNIPVLWSQYIDMNEPAARFQEEAMAHYRATDGGKFLMYWKTDNECVQPVVVFRPNIYMSAPWAQARIQNVGALRPLEPLSPDPTSSYYAEDNLVSATAPESYLETSQS